MTDLLKQLRTPMTGWPDDVECVDAETAEKAADMIEHLRGAHDALRREIEQLRTAMFNAINETNRLARGDENYTIQALQEQIAKISARLTAAYNAEQELTK